ncbi:MAG: A/G-specific adenine glycosylase [Litorivicinus sp.]
MNPFARDVLNWFDQHGRHDLPWQGRGAYVTWVSEIMLQQTQVNTVIPYFERFMARFPTMQALADAEVDEVLAHWAGLGYYARGRNLHKTAQLLNGGEMPKTLAELEALPGIGRSTAGAILAMGHGLYGSILDGNVKRVLARHSAEPQWPGSTAAQQRLWNLAEQYTPLSRCGDYAQAMMDLGATICTRSKPKCSNCPLKPTCASHHQGLIAIIPHPKPKKAKPKKTRWWLVWQDAKQRVFLHKRPGEGLWGGLYCLPETDELDRLSDLATALTGAPVDALKFTPLDPIEHSFSHYDLVAKPMLLKAPGLKAADNDSQWAWPDSQLGVPAPVARLLKRLIEAPTGDLFGEHE